MCQVDIKRPARPPHREVDVFTTLFTEVTIPVCQTHPGGTEGSRSRLHLESMPCVDAHLRSPSPSKLSLFSAVNSASLQHICCNGPSIPRCFGSLSDPDKQDFSSAVIYFLMRIFIHENLYGWYGPVNEFWCLSVPGCALTLSASVWVYPILGVRPLPSQL